MFGQRADGDTYGVELATNYTVSERWRLSTQYTFLQMHIYERSGYAGGRQQIPATRFTCDRPGTCARTSIST